jgi:predicted transcriptional regulator
MTKLPKDTCPDPSEEFTIRIPCALAQRVVDFANDNESTVSSVIVEAIDFFLRHRSTQR